MYIYMYTYITLTHSSIWKTICKISQLYIEELFSVEQVKQHGFCNRAGTYKEVGKGSRMLKDTFGR